MDILKYNEINRAQWSSFVHQHHKGNVFQTPEMYDVYMQTPGYTPQVLGLVHDKQLIGLLLWVVIREKGIKAKFSARSIIHGAPLVRDDKPEYIAVLLETYDQQREKGIIYTQIRNYFEMLTVNDVFQKYGYRFKSHLNFIISLDSVDAVWNRIGKGRIKQIKKAEKNGLYVEVYESGKISEELLIQGYNIIQSVYQHAKLPLVDIEHLYAVKRQKLLVLFVVRDHDGQILGSRFGLIFKKSLYGWYAGSYRKYYNLFPNDMLIWGTLKWGVENGYSVFDYGGAGEPNKPYGVRTFKQQMGGALVNHGRYEKIHRYFMYYLGLMGMRIIRILKH